MKKLLKFWIFWIAIQACSNSGTSILPVKQTIRPRIKDGFNIVGHRGFSSVYPQNTISAFLRAIDIGVDMVELDVCITKDNQVVVSHDQYMDSAFMNKPDGTPVTKAEEEQYILFNMVYSEIKKFDAGSRTTDYKRTRLLYPEYKPLLKDLLIECENYIQQNNKQPITYIVEIKSRKNPVGKYQPASMQEFCSLVNEAIGVIPQAQSKIIINSFDETVLTTWKKNRESGRFLNVPLGYYVNDSTLKAEEHVRKLGFQPELLSPNGNYTGLQDDIVYCHLNGIKLIPWSINSLRQILLVKNLGGDGVLTDIPNVYYNYIGK